MILLITGPCASGKTTVARLLCDQNNFQMLDGDQLLREQGLRSKNWNEIHETILEKSTRMHTTGTVVISHVILPEKIPVYQDWFADHKILFNTVILFPQKTTLHSRSITRTSHPKPTPPDIIESFHEKFTQNIQPLTNTWILDNSDEDPESTVKKVLSILS